LQIYQSNLYINMLIIRRKSTF